MTLPRILLISTGGTITMTPGAGPGITPTLSGDDLVRAVPELASRAALDVVSYSMKPGASLTLPDLLAIAALIDGMDASLAGAVVVQGTDTIEETAFVLDNVVATDRPVVVTGAMRGAGAPGADGPANLLAAVILAGSEAARGLGAMAVLNDEVHAARFVRKTHTGAPSAFASPGFAPIGRIVEGELHLHARLPRLPALAPLPPADAIDAAPVALLALPLGDDGRLLDALPGLGYRGAVIEAMGAGHLPAQCAERLQRLAQAMPVVLATRVASGAVFEKTYGFAGSETDLIARGAIPAGYLPGAKACLLLRLLLAAGLRGAELESAFRLRSRAALIR